VVSRSKDYALAAFAGIRLADDMALMLAPRYIITHVRELLQQSSVILRWELFSIIGGVFLLFSLQELPCQWLWMVKAGETSAKGAFLSIETRSWRGPANDWCVRRQGINYRFRGLGLCTLAVLLLYALGWISRS
jgi:hypothetical protein